MPKIDKSYTEQISVKMTPETYSKVDQMARKKGMSKSQLLRKVLEQYLGGQGL